jgi:hypothetical protein
MFGHLLPEDQIDNVPIRACVEKMVPTPPVQHLHRSQNLGRSLAVAPYSAS